MNNTRTALARGGRGPMFIDRRELSRIRRLQNIQGTDVSVSSRGVSVKRPFRREIPQRIPGPFNYTGPFACVIDGDQIDIGYQGVGINRIDSIVFGNQNILPLLNPFTPSTAIPSTETATEFVMVAELQFTSEFSGAVHSQYLLTRTNMLCGPILTDIKYPTTVIGQDKQNKPYDVSNTFAVPLCKFTVDADRNPIDVVQLQWGPIILRPAKANIYYDYTNNRVATRLVVTGSASADDQITTIAAASVPFNSENENIYHRGDGGTIGLDGESWIGAADSMIIGQISTNSVGDVVKLWDFTTHVGMSRRYTDTLY